MLCDHMIQIKSCAVYSVHGSVYCTVQRKHELHLLLRKKIDLSVGLVTHYLWQAFVLLIGLNLALA